MKILVALLIAGCLAAQSTFEVKEIDPAVVAKLHSAETKLEAALTALKSAQAAAEDAKAVRDKITEQVKSANGAYSGECAYSSVSGLVSSNYISQASRKVRSVEIRGKYALVTEGMEPCYLTSGTALISPATIGTIRSITPNDGAFLK